MKWLKEIFNTSYIVGVLDVYSIIMIIYAVISGVLFRTRNAFIDGLVIGVFIGLIIGVIGEVRRWWKLN